MRALLALIALSSSIAIAHSAEVTLDLPGEIDDRTVSYSCEDGTELDVRYVNAGNVSLAIFDWEGERYVGSAGVSASGARYVADRFVWWTSGEEAMLSDELEGADADPLATCTGE
jgi:membrane-bound inhibitor of C-type lysozyme